MDAKLIVTSRELKGSANARRMRRAGLIPGVIYSAGGEAREISLPQHEFQQMLRHHAGDQMMVEIAVDGKDGSVLLKDVQYDALSGDVIHVDFMEVSMTEKLKVQIALELIGEPEGVKTQGGVLDHTLYSVEVECLPGDILEKIEVDVSNLAVGDVLTVKDIAVDATKHEILEDADLAVASVLAPRVVVDDEGEEGEESAEPEVITEKKEEGAE
ncbi:MAG: 50S ribosomal protein L25 [Kiritimatiellaceae bacterium]|nr:50S ribosomal protein L25 [Kiritimatiellaceae bacterium]